MKEHKQQQQQVQKNMDVLNNCEFDFTYHNQYTLLFRVPGKPKIDFYPSTGRWKIGGKNQHVMTGGAEAFLNWFRKQACCS